MSAPFVCKHCGGPVNAKLNGDPLPCPNLGCPCDIGIDRYAHVRRRPAQGTEQSMRVGSNTVTAVCGFPVKTSEHVPEDKVIVTGALPEGAAPSGGAPTALVGLYAYEEVGIHGVALDMHIGELEHARRLLHDLYESGDMDNMHTDGCPEDSTCRCPRVMVLNLVMLGWKPPDVPPTCGHFTLQPFPNLHSETAPTEVVTTGQATSKSTYAVQRLVVCAANRNAAGQIVVSARHVDERMREQMKAFGDRSSWFKAEQGFIDQYGTFMTRTEAWKVAEAAGQIRYRCGGDTADGGTLFSDNLY